MTTLMPAQAAALALEGVGCIPAIKLGVEVDTAPAEPVPTIVTGAFGDVTDGNVTVGLALRTEDGTMLGMPLARYREVGPGTERVEEYARQMASLNAEVVLDGVREPTGVTRLHVQLAEEPELKQPSGAAASAASTNRLTGFSMDDAARERLRVALAQEVTRDVVAFASRGEVMDRSTRLALEALAAGAPQPILIGFRLVDQTTVELQGDSSLPYWVDGVAYLAVFEINGIVGSTTAWPHPMEIAELIAESEWQEFSATAQQSLTASKPVRRALLMDPTTELIRQAEQLRTLLEAAILPTAPKGLKVGEYPLAMMLGTTPIDEVKARRGESFTFGAPVLVGAYGGYIDPLNLSGEGEAEPAIDETEPIDVPEIPTEDPASETGDAMSPDPVAHRKAAFAASRRAARRAAYAARTIELANPWHDERGRFAEKGTGSIPGDNRFYDAVAERQAGPPAGNDTDPEEWQRERDVEIENAMYDARADLEDDGVDPEEAERRIMAEIAEAEAAVAGPPVGGAIRSDVADAGLTAVEDMQNVVGDMLVNVTPVELLDSINGARAMLERPKRHDAADLARQLEVIHDAANEAADLARVAGVITGQAEGQRIAESAADVLRLMLAAAPAGSTAESDGELLFPDLAPGGLATQLSDTRKQLALAAARRLSARPPSKTS